MLNVKYIINIIRKMMNIFKWYYRFLLFLFTGFMPVTGQSSVPIKFKTAQILDLKSLSVTVKKPAALSVSLYGDIFIVDPEQHLLIRLDPNGAYVNHTGGFGWNDQQLDTPKDVSTYDGLNIYVADYQNQRIQRYNRNLQYISSTGQASGNRLGMDSKISQGTDVGYPAALAISPLGDMFCVDQEKNQVIRISSTGLRGLTFGGFESGRGQLNSPSRIRVTKDRVYILDQSRIVMYDYFGNYLSELSHSLVRRPGDLFVDRYERIYIAESSSRVVLIFRPNGQLIAQISDFDFSIPAGLAVAGNRLYVLDSGLMQIVVFQISESR